MFIFHLNGLKDTQGTPPAKQKSSSNNKKSVEDTVQEHAAPLFEFYERLKNEEVEVPEYPSQQEAAKAQQAKQTHHFHLQVASFAHKKDAEKLRVNLILLNMEARIEASKLESGAIRYRVIVGPYVSKSKLAKARQALVSNGYEFLTLKRPIEK